MRLASLCGLAVFAVTLPSYAEGPTFDVASVKMADPAAQPPFTITGGPGTSDPSRFSAPRIGMFALLRRAFNVDYSDQIAGPAWLLDATSPDYGIIATMPADTTKEQFQMMLQNLLIERFHLVFHRETRNFPGYALVVDKGGPKFKEATQPQVPTPDGTGDPRAILTAPRGEDGFAIRSGSTVSSQTRPGGDERWKFQERTMAQFLLNLGNLIRSTQGKGLGSPVPRIADKTGLTGKYTFILEFQDPSMANLSGLFPRVAGADSDTGNVAAPVAGEPGGTFPNIFTAIQKQLGLRLDKVPDVPVDIIVVDSVDKTPTED